MASSPRRPSLRIRIRQSHEGPEAAIAEAKSMESTKAPSRSARPAEMPSNAKGNLQ